MLETDDPVDDIRIDYSSGWTTFVQAKRTLQKGPHMVSAIKQWVEAGKGSLNPESQRLVIVTGSMSGSVRVLRSVLDRLKTDIPGALTDKEDAALQYVTKLMNELTPDQRDRVLRCASIQELSVEESYLTDAVFATELLSRLIEPEKAGDALNAWSKLIAIAGRAARLRGGYFLKGWASALEGEGVELKEGGGSPTASPVRRIKALSRYSQRLIRDGSHVDLRGLGIAIPPVPIEEIDADVAVKTNSGGASNEPEEILWAFMRRGRLILTGLPGAGKSTAMKQLAARLSNLRDAPVPAYISLKDVDSSNGDQGFRDRLLDAAVRNDSAVDRPFIRDELEHRLDEGGIALLLDSLDETYDRRSQVVREIDSLMRGVHEDVDIVVATRDVAYGQAATLGFESARLTAPKDVTRTIETILRRYNAGDTGASNSSEWVASRIAWVKNSVANEATLRETPLLPVLLASLAAGWSTDNLPLSRALVLKAVVEDLVTRREATRRNTPIGKLTTHSEIVSGTLDVFRAEASAILSHSGNIPLSQLVISVASEVQGRWGFSRLHAEATARDIIHFWDQNGIFVISGSDELVSPRVALFAEIGDALNAVEDGALDLKEWIDSRIEKGQLEPLTLASALSPPIAYQVNAAAVLKAERGLLHAVARAISEGAVLDTASAHALHLALIADISTGGQKGWESFEILLTLHLSESVRSGIDRALASFPEDSVAIAAALLEALRDIRLESYPTLSAQALRPLMSPFRTVSKATPEDGEATGGETGGGDEMEGMLA